MRKVNLFAAILFLLIAYLSVQGQTESNMSSNLHFKDLKLQIVLPRAAVLPLEPIPLIIRLRNPTNQSIMGHKSIGFSSNKIYIFVRRNGGQQIQIRQLSPFLGLVSVEESEIPSGASFQTQELLSYGISDYFPDPGNYEIQVVLVNNAGTQIKSDLIPVKLIVPTGANLAVYELIKNHLSGHSLFNPGEFKNSTGLLETIANQYPNSDYAKNAYFALGEGYFTQKQYSKAETYLNKLKSDKDFVFSQRVNAYLRAIEQKNAPASFIQTPQ